MVRRTARGARWEPRSKPCNACAADWKVCVGMWCVGVVWVERSVERETVPCANSVAVLLCVREESIMERLAGYSKECYRREA